MIPRRSFSPVFTALALMLSSVILFEQPVSAISPVENEIIIQQKSEQVAQASDELEKATQEIEAIEAKKKALAEQLDNMKKAVEELNQKLEEKKAAAEAERKRVEELRNMFVHINRYASDSAGNAYAPGNCTWYVKQKRPDISNYWGNANMWYANAAAQGWRVGLTPKKGAIATTTAGWAGHVAYVEGVSLDGQYVTISEMNFGGLYITNTRTVHYSEFKYIYDLN